MGVTHVPEAEKYFQTEDDALEYAIHNQRNRRNLTAAEMLNCVRVLDERKQPKFYGNRHTSSLAQNCATLKVSEPTPLHTSPEPSSLDVAESIASTLSAIPKGKSAQQTANLHCNPQNTPKLPHNRSFDFHG